jgi:hypothetical protein
MVMMKTNIRQKTSHEIYNAVRTKGRKKKAKEISLSMCSVGKKPAQKGGF